MEPNIGAGHLGADGGDGGDGVLGGGGDGGLGGGGRVVGQMAPMLKPRLGDMYQEESEEEGELNLILKRINGQTDSSYDLGKP